MPKVRFDVAAKLVALSPLHVGSGHVRRVTAVRGREDANAAPEVAAIVRDATGAPYIPPTTIKGVLRRLAEETFGAGSPEVARLFGVIGGENGTGRQGLLLARGAPRIDTPPDVTAAPYADQAGGGATALADGALGRGVFVAARTSVDRKTGTAADSTLFFQEMVAPTTAFGFRCSIESRDEATAKAALADLARLLEALKAPGGVGVGKNQTDGFGRLKLAGPATCTRHAIAPDGGFAGAAYKLPSPSSALAASSIVKAVPLQFVCEGPFAIVDASRRTSRQTVENPEDRMPQLSAQRLKRDLPLILGSSISGALRTRAAWLDEIRALRAKAPSPGASIPDRRVLRRKKDLDRLTGSERLFGVTGFRGLVSIESLDVKAATPLDVTSVKIDRFSGAPVDNALFTTAAFTGVEFTVTIALRRRGDVAPTEDDVALFDALVADLTDGGAKLGHGTNKGFGWFTVTGGGHAGH